MLKGATTSKSCVARSAPCANAATPPITTNSIPASRSLGIRSRNVAIKFFPCSPKGLLNFEEPCKFLYPLRRCHCQVGFDLPQVHHSCFIQWRIIGKVYQFFV